MALSIDPATPSDIPVLLRCIPDLARCERDPDAVVSTEEILAEQLFGERPAAEALLARRDGRPVGFAVFFHSGFAGSREG